MLSKSAIKHINALKVKKFRQKHHKFTAEGDKIVREMLQNTKISFDKIYCTSEWAEENTRWLLPVEDFVEVITLSDLKKISSLQTPNQVLATCYQLDHIINEEELRSSISLVLDGIQDPGNMGTILRIADWFGIAHVFCSNSCVDVYNPKVVQASMGAFLRVKVIYQDLEALFGEHPQLPVYGAMLGGENLFQTKKQQQGFIVIGNEGNGISEEVLPFVTQQIAIPGRGGAESLNAAVATGIICAFFTNKQGE